MEIIEYAHNYQSATQYFEKLVSRLSAKDLDKGESGEWTPRQVIHHMADSEAQSYARIRRLVAEPEGSVIQGYDEGLWAQSHILGYTELPVENSLAIFSSVRAGSLEIIKRLSLADLERFGQHTEAGKYTIAKWLQTYTNHPQDHGGQIEKVINN